MLLVINKLLAASECEWGSFIQPKSQENVIFKHQMYLVLKKTKQTKKQILAITLRSWQCISSLYKY